MLFSSLGIITRGRPRFPHQNVFARGTSCGSTVQPHHCPKVAGPASLSAIHVEINPISPLSRSSQYTGSCQYFFILLRLESSLTRSTLRLKEETNSRQVFPLSTPCPGFVRSFWELHSASKAARHAATR